MSRKLERASRGFKNLSEECRRYLKVTSQHTEVRVAVDSSQPVARG
jgi:hypothetical protein